MALSLLRSGQLTRLAAVGGNHPQPGADATDDDSAAFSPGSAAQGLVGVQPLGGATIQSGRPQLAAHLEANLPAVTGEEDIASAVGAQEGLWIRI